MTFHQHRPAKPVPVMRTVAVNLQDQKRLSLARLFSTALIGAALLSGSALYAKADDASAKHKANTKQQQVKPDKPVKATAAAGEAAAAGKTETTAESPQKPVESTDADKAKDSEQQNKSAVNSSADQTQQVPTEPEQPDYLDDRSTPQTLLQSYYNAINRKEYARAFSYLEDGTHEPDFNVFAEGFKDTKSVKVKLGDTQPDPGAGQIYWTLPLAIEATQNDGKSQVYTGCYTLHMSSPVLQELPPFKPMRILTGTLSKSPKGLEDSVPEECEAP